MTDVFNLIMMFLILMAILIVAKRLDTIINLLQEIANEPNRKTTKTRADVGN